MHARLCALAAAVALLLAPSASSASAAASVIEAAAPTPTPAPSAEPGEAVFTLSPISSGLIQPGQPLNVSVTMTNDTDTTTLGGTVSIGFGTAAFTSRGDLDDWLDGDTTGSAVTEVGLASFPAVAARSGETQGVTVDAGVPAISSLGPGAYPVVATLTTPTAAYTSTSVVVVAGDTTREVGVGVVVPITAQATGAGLLTAAELDELTSPEGSLTAQLDAVDGTEAILAVDPAVVAAIRVLGTSAPESAAAWLTRLMAIPNTRFALQYGDADVASQVQAGIVPLLEPTSLSYAMTPADFTPIPSETSAPTPSPTPTGDPTAGVYPDMATLLDIGVARAGVFWPETGTAGSSVVAALGGEPVDGQESLTVIPSTTTIAGVDGATIPARGDAGSAPVLVYDAAVSEQLEEASALDEGALRNAHLAAATAFLSFALAETDGAPLLVTVDRGENRSRVALRTAISTALQAPSAVPSTLGALANAPASAVEVTDVPPDDARVAAASGLVSGEEQLTQFASVLDDPSQITGRERNEILQLLGEGWRSDPEAWGVALSAHREATVATLGSVGILRASPIQLITSGAIIPVWIRNDLPYPVNVTLLAAPDDLRLEVQESTQVVAQPQSNTRVEVPVQAQIGSGDVTIALELRSPTGVRIGEPQVREVHVRADWEGIGLVILAVLAVGFVLLGVVRTILRRRRARAEAGPEAQTHADAEAGPEAQTHADTEAGPGTHADAHPGPEPGADADTETRRDAERGTVEEEKS
ncbi:DUF6049 family protein [Microbacterium sp. BK668]|uniref:DUF6049 family protein n=1 Tax=Microbacterium sp. BK668 TaxID=2512118 RepID=UPI0010602F16|nr:DUF6049 family protein [Microbacterium sp. BK668]